ncbi:MAG: hypothetical protein KDC66_16515 [Phaeodactylibacter sp.]|nr:hypothetical protein [Phaeodactylibacter sp.]MCB9272540.1 hypothetical protein [Lewinellaceae bacterium]
MDKLWPFFKSLFTKAEESSPSQPLLHELIERSETERQEYEHWKNTLARRHLSDWLWQQYGLYQALPAEIDEAAYFLDTPSSKGFAIRFSGLRYSDKDAVFFFDYLKEKVCELGYRPQISDTRAYNRPNWVETMEKHYLKPRPKNTAGGKYQQRFGNITIELELRDGQAHSLRFRATSYNDRLFEKAEEFAGLMQQLLEG